MKTSIDALNDLITRCGDDWKQILDDYFKDNEEISGEVNETIEIFLRAYKEDTISNNQTNLKKIKNMISNDLLYKNLNNYVRDLLSAYYSAAPLRALWAQDAEKASKTVREIFDRAILRFDISIADEYEKYGFSSQEALYDYLNTLDNMCTFIVQKNLHRTSIEWYVKFHLRFSNEMCKKLTDAIDTNLNQLKMNYIIDKLKFMDISDK